MTIITVNNHMDKSAILRKAYILPTVQIALGFVSCNFPVAPNRTLIHVITYT